MKWAKVKQIVKKYVPDVAPFFPEDYEHRPNIEELDHVVNALFEAEQTFVVTGQETAGKECYDAAVELILWVERFKL